MKALWSEQSWKLRCVQTPQHLCTDGVHRLVKLGKGAVAGMAVRENPVLHSFRSEGPGHWAAEGLTSESVSEELELEELEESLELSEAMPVDSWRSTASARTASSGCSCFKILKGKRYCSQGCDSWWQHPLKTTDSKWRTPLLAARGNP